MSVFPGWRDTQKMWQHVVFTQLFCAGYAFATIIKPTRKLLPAHLPRASNYDKQQGVTCCPHHLSSLSLPFLLQLVLSCCLSPARGTEQRTVNYDLQHLQPPAVAFLDDEDDDDDDDFDSATLASTLSLSPQCNWNSNNNSNSNTSGSNHSSGSNSCR